MVQPPNHKNGGEVVRRELLSKSDKKPSANAGGNLSAYTPGAASSSGRAERDLPAGFASPKEELLDYGDVEEMPQANEDIAKTQAARPDTLIELRNPAGGNPLPLGTVSHPGSRPNLLQVLDRTSLCEYNTSYCVCFSPMLIITLFRYGESQTRSTGIFQK